MSLNRRLTAGYPLHCELDSRGRADLAAWLAEGSLLLRVQPAITAEALVQLGWNESIEDLVAAARAKEDDWREFGVWHCDVVHVFLLGGSGVGKVGVVGVGEE